MNCDGRAYTMLKLGKVRWKLGAVIENNIVIETKNTFSKMNVCESKLQQVVWEIIRSRYTFANPNIKNKAIRHLGRKQNLIGLDLYNRVIPSTSSTTTASVPELVIPDSDMWIVEMIIDFEGSKCLIASKPTTVPSRITARYCRRMKKGRKMHIFSPIGKKKNTYFFPQLTKKLKNCTKKG